jgi:hypothetical protein
MMRSTLVAFVTAYSMAGLTLVACSDDTGGGGQDAATDGPSVLDGQGADALGGDATDSAVGHDVAVMDASPDVTSDVFQTADASNDSDASDAAPSDGSDEADTGTVEASDASGAADVRDSASGDARDAGHVDAADAAVDVHEDGNIDAGDATIDVREAGEMDGADATLDANDAADSMSLDAADAADVIVYPPGLLDYPDAYAHAYCQGLGGCCPTEDMDACVANNGANTSGWEGTLPGHDYVYTGGHLTFDQDAATKCLEALTAFPCSSDGGGVISAAGYAGITEACRNVFGGTIPIDAGGCSSSYECVAGAYCNVTPEGGVCSPLVGDGGICTSDNMCSSAATGTPALFCNNVLNLLADGGLGTGTCVPLDQDGVSCVDNTQNPYNYSCSSLLCGDNSTCGGQLSFGVSCP